MMFPTAFVSTALFAASYVSAAPMNIVSRADVFSGDGTTYSPSVGIGACGLLNADTEMVVALGHDLFDNWPGAGANPNRNPICGRTLTATNPNNGVSIDVKVVDRCQACVGNDVDFSPSAFADLYGGADTGRFPINWSWDASDDSGSGTGTGPCGSVPAWSATGTYWASDSVSYNGELYTAKWWNQGAVPGADTDPEPWTDSGAC